jgi:hypothetical protein
VNATVRPEVDEPTRFSGVPTFCVPGLTKVIVCAFKAVTVTVAFMVVVAPAVFVTVSA